MRRSWVFALPPSVPDTATRTAQVRTALSTIGCHEVKTALTYALLLDDLVEGKVDAAWAPPLLVARLEGVGCRVLLRGLRGGSASYRGVLFARADRGLKLETLSGVTAGWLDQRSMSGYVLPRALLARHHGTLEKALAREKFLGSYHGCVQAVLEGRVDVSATFASGAGATTERLGFRDLAAERADQLTALGFTDECPNDAIVLSPQIQGAEAQEFIESFARMHKDALPARALAHALEVDAFEVPSAGSYRRLASEFLEGGNAPAR